MEHSLLAPSPINPPPAEEENVLEPIGPRPHQKLWQRLSSHRLLLYTLGIGLLLLLIGLGCCQLEQMLRVEPLPQSQLHRGPDSPARQVTSLSLDCER